MTPAVPHLTTALKGPLQQLERHLLTHQAEIEAWLRSQWQATPAPFYTSVDLRNAGFKLAPVDTNLFPAGFNNLNPAFAPLSVQAIQTAIERLSCSTVGVLLIAEGHTRNPYYLENLAALSELLGKAGVAVRIGLLQHEGEGVVEHTLQSGRTLRLGRVERSGDRLVQGDFSPCLVLLNNDLSGGWPPILEGIAQPILPPPGLGWHDRLKSSHFTHYRKVAEAFAALVEIDPWLIDPLFCNCGKIDFKQHKGIECLSDSVSDLLFLIRRKYKEYGVDRDPFVVLKADAGTYGMAVMTIRSVDEVRELNRKQRTRMSTSKGGQQVSRVILQEGVYTFETWGKDAVAEPVVYLFDHHVVGGFYRVHTERGENENLNAPGMRFEPLSFAASCITPDLAQEPDAEPNRFYAYGVIARLATLAAAREIAVHEGQVPSEELGKGLQTA